MTSFSLLAPLADHVQGWHHGGWWPLWPLLWIAILGVVVWLVARRTRDGRPREPLEHAREILAERYARGELTSDEYRERLEGLR